MKPWAIRVASRPEDGAGHVMRGAALAHALSAHVPVRLVLDDAVWSARLAKSGIDACLAGAVMPATFDAAVLDGYNFSDADMRHWRNDTGFLAVIDDFLRPPPIADLVVNVTPGLKGEAVDGIPALLGPGYALLGPTYEVVQPSPVPHAVGHVLVSLGAMDAANASALALQALAQLAGNGFRPKVTVVLGGMAPHRADISARLEAWGSKAQLAVDVENMTALYGAADLVIGAGGVGLLERMVCGVPSLSLIVADNQRAAVEGAASAEATVNMGLFETLSVATLADGICALVDDPARRRVMVAAGRHMVDGRGSQRVAKHLIEMRADSRRDASKAEIS